MEPPKQASLQDLPVPVKLKLALLWTSVMFCYVYGDYFGLYQPGKLAGMLAGRMAPLGPTTQGVLVFTTLMMAVPSAMVFLSVALRPAANRWANLALGPLYTLIILATLRGSWAYYQVLGIIEMALTLLVAWYAWTWPREAA